MPEHKEPPITIHTQHTEVKKLIERDPHGNAIIKNAQLQQLIQNGINKAGSKTDLTAIKVGVVVDF